MNPSPAESHAPPPLPHFAELEVPRHWRAVDLISDLHLSAATPCTVAALVAHLRHTNADAVFILGDLFDVWIGDDAMNEPFEAQCVELLAEATSRQQLGFLPGNRDFLVGSSFLAATGMRALAEPTVLCAWGQRFLLTHGDALCLEDQPYQSFRRMVRSSEWQRSFLNKPLKERAALAANIRAQSEAHKKSSMQWADVDSAAAVAWMHSAGTSEMIHGHTHRPGSDVLAPGFKRHVLSDWDCDHGIARAEVLRVSRDGLTRVPPSLG